MMAKHLSVCLVAAMVAVLTGCPAQVTATTAAPARAPQITQVSTIDALLAGVYDGVMPLSELSQHGDFGIGTFHALDGEMVLLDGQFYQIRADGHVYRPAPTVMTPFASVCPSAGLRSLALPVGAMDMAAVQAAVDAAQPNMNLFEAVRVDGTFSYVKTRSVPAQQVPYPPLAEVTKTQPVFERKDVKGTVVGFRCPPFVKGVNVPGYHLHFLSDDRTFGGHILGFTADNVTVKHATVRRFNMILPDDAAHFGAVDLGKDRSHELESAEKEK